jgi:DNA (cytosine-5)-methyltransferase 1
MTRPLLLDLFCGAGGAAVGYHRAGFDIIGIDNKPQPNYPFEFHQGDALGLLHPLKRRVAAIHASPPCQYYSQMTKCRPGLAETYPDLIHTTRLLLKLSRLPYIIENVVGAPLHNPIQICGSGLGMTLQRHRLFESNIPLWGVPCAHGQNRWNPAYRHATNRNRRRVPVIGEWRIPKQLQDKAMGINWMTLEELSEAIPPAYTEHIGHQLITHIKAATP